ncbi:T9SS type A sorting domain-containing protein [Mangrovimonas spongiae]|uniref:T9SS C-terminal target domain-containing protein n=1 Tax=Mangrovimonas spongiae TaxID=2494697 RepID=A0A3R9N6A4_9FLAO|nr:T9SS C-terminal target domain-containing protein [Mangrovimonas spongiae]
MLRQDFFLTNHIVLNIKTHQELYVLLYQIHNHIKTQLVKLSSGVYFFQITTGLKTTIKKVVKM